MDETYLGRNEVVSVLELILVAIFMCVGVLSIQLHVRYIGSRTALQDDYDKVAADVEYEEVADKCFRFTPYQAYMMGYYMDNFGPNNENSIFYVDTSYNIVNHRGQGFIKLSPTTYSGNYRNRNNMISGVNMMNNKSVKGIMDTVYETYKSSGGGTLGEFYRETSPVTNIGFVLMRSDNYYVEDGNGHNTEVITDGNTERKDFKWVMVPIRQGQLLAP